MNDLRCPGCGAGAGIHCEPGCTLEQPRNAPAAGAAKAVHLGKGQPLSPVLRLKVRKLSPKPGDLIVVQHLPDLCEAERQQLLLDLELLSRKLGCTVMLMPVGVEVGIVPQSQPTPEHIKAALDRAAEKIRRNVVDADPTVPLTPEQHAVYADLLKFHDPVSLPNSLDAACTAIEREVADDPIHGPPDYALPSYRPCSIFDHDKGRVCGEHCPLSTADAPCWGQVTASEELDGTPLHVCEGHSYSLRCPYTKSDRPEDADCWRVTRRHPPAKFAPGPVAAELVDGIASPAVTPPDGEASEGLTVPKE